MHSKHHNMPGHKSPTHKTNQRQHHDGHSHGHPTKHGLSENPLPEVGMNAPDYGSMAEHGLSEGNTRAVVNALPIGECNDSLLEQHGLQHVDYGELTGHNFTTTSEGHSDKDDY